MRELEMRMERRERNAWITTFTTNDPKTIYSRLAEDLAARYIGRAGYVKRITRCNNYDGTATYTVYHDNGFRAVFIADIYC